MNIHSFSKIHHIMIRLMGSLVLLGILIPGQTTNQEESIKQRPYQPIVQAIGHYHGLYESQQLNVVQDNFGYTFKDSTEQDGPIYTWEEISVTGNPPGCIYSTLDDYTCEMPLGFTFPFYGKFYSGVFYNLDGYLSFGQGYGTNPTSGIPNYQNPNNEIAIFGEHLKDCWPYTVMKYQMKE